MGKRHRVSFAVFPGVQDDVVAFAGCGPEAVDPAGLELAVLDELGKHLLAVLKEFPGGFPVLFRFQDVGVFTLELPGAEEEGPVDVGDQFFEGHVLPGSVGPRRGAR